MAKSSYRRLAIGLVGLVSGTLGGQLMLPTPAAEAAWPCDESFVLESVEGPADVEAFWMAPQKPVTAQRTDNTLSLHRDDRRYSLRLQKEDQ